MPDWVLHPFLTEMDVLILNKENLLQEFADCSKPLIIDGIQIYIDDKTKPDKIKNILKSVYMNKLLLIEAQNNPGVSTIIGIVKDYTFNSVHAGLTIDQLCEMKDNINSVYKVEAFVPYINVIPSDNIAYIINSLLALYRVNKNVAYKNLAVWLKLNTRLFKDKPNATATGTIFKSISRRSNDLDIILRGIEFLIDMKQKGTVQESWRLF